MTVEDRRVFEGVGFREAEKNIGAIVLKIIVYCCTCITLCKRSTKK